MTARPMFILAAILFGVGLGLDLLGIDRYVMAFLLAGLMAGAVGHAV